MFKLYKQSEENFVILEDDKPIFSGTAEDVQYRLEGLGLAEYEVELAINWLLTTDDNMAHFGMKRTAMFTTWEDVA